MATPLLTTLQGMAQQSGAESVDIDVALTESVVEAAPATTVDVLQGQVSQGGHLTRGDRGVGQLKLRAPTLPRMSAPYGAQTGAKRVK